MPLEREGSSIYLLFPKKCKYFLYILVVIIAIICYQAFNFFNRIPFNKSPNPLTLNPSSSSFTKDTVILLTGGNTGIGKETANILSLTGATIILGCRSIKRGKLAKNDIIKYNNGTNTNIFVYEIDLSSIASVDKFIETIKQKYNKIDILICNAAINPLQIGLKTKDGLEIAFGVNHIGHMHLVLQLKDIITMNGKIIIVSAHPYLDERANQIFDINNLNGFNKWDAYLMSKMENIMFTREFAKRYPLDNNNNGVYIMVTHPGVGITDIFKERDQKKDIIKQPNIVLLSIVNVLFGFLGDTIDQLAYTQVYLALTDPKQLVHGAHYRNDVVQTYRGGVVDNDRLCEQLWDKSEEIINNIRNK